MSQTDNAIAAIKGMIQAGELHPGDRLPPERELGERLGVSRNSLREAVKSLETINVLSVRRGDGTYVTSLEPTLLLEGISFLVDIHDDATLIEMFGVRRVLEAAAARAAATRATPALVTRLEEILESSRGAESVDDLVEHDTVFHREIASAARNRYLSGMLDTLSSSTVRARVWRGLSQGGAVERTLAEHRAILDAIRAGDADLASALMTTHIAGVETWLRGAAGRWDPEDPRERPVDDGS
ncbi:FadR/GntR family transcriptional regulator [Microbacterium aquimaris]|uniref:FadR/GntR family transcriptional regulator n=1 Tax=Microbacterium aquimaris TaxID=459816 RepID=A0ABU5N2R5_9MICO|nr:FadR/GntR family transcriptional regulator [Microbacterium aquimaris]MDZ8160368.1 FadR/GntR family transcriptional regulator [Microbacterium aquimaris]